MYFEYNQLLKTFIVIVLEQISICKFKMSPRTVILDCRNVGNVKPGCWQGGLSAHGNAGPVPTPAIAELEG